MRKRKLEVATVQQMLADHAAEESAKNQREYEEAGIESPMVRVSVLDLLFWGGEIFLIGACMSLLIALLLKQ